MTNDTYYEIWVAVDPRNSCFRRRIKKHMWKVNTFKNKKEAQKCFDKWHRLGYSVMRSDISYT